MITTEGSYVLWDCPVSDTEPLRILGIPRATGKLDLVFAPFNSPAAKDLRRLLSLHSGYSCSCLFRLGRN